MGQDLSAVHTWVILWKAARSIELSARKNIESLGLGLSDFAVLEVLLHKGSLPVNVVGAKIMLTSGSVTTAIDRLENRNLVERGSDASDRRTRIVHLTESGRKLIECAFKAHAEGMEEIFIPLAAKDRARLIRLLKKVGRYAQHKHDQ